MRKKVESAISSIHNMNRNGKVAFVVVIVITLRIILESVFFPQVVSFIGKISPQYDNYLYSMAANTLSPIYEPDTLQIILLIVFIGHLLWLNGTNSQSLSNIQSKLSDVQKNDEKQDGQYKVSQKEFAALESSIVDAEKKRKKSETISSIIIVILVMVLMFQEAQMDAQRDIYMQYSNYSWPVYSYLSDEECNDLRAEFAQVKTRDDYNKIIFKLKAIAEEHNVTIE